jgi:phospholipid transport system substrate-binding protein
MIMLRALTSVLTFGLLAITSPASSATCPAEGYIQNVGAAFMSAARTGSPGAFTGAASRYADLRSIALFALGPYRKKLPRGREGEYVTLTKKFMGRFMAQYSNKFSGSGIKITSCAGTTIGTRLSTGQNLTFRLRRAGGGYRVEDVSVSSVWMVQQMRSKFTSVMNRNGGDIDALMSYLGN